jgi:hypothetical protein
MRNVLCLACALLLVASVASAGDAVWQMPATVTTSAVARTSDCQSFVGSLQELTIYCGSATGQQVHVSLIDPYDSSALVLATNASASGTLIYRPRIVAPAVSGVTSHTVTNSGDTIYVDGETLRAQLDGVTGTNEVLTFRVKFVRE